MTSRNPVVRACAMAVAASALVIGGACALRLAPGSERDQRRIRADSPFDISIPPRAVQSYQRLFHELPSPQWTLSLLELGSQSLPTSLVGQSGRLFLATASGVVIAVDLTSKRAIWRRSPTQFDITPRRLALLSDRTLAVMGDAGDPIILLSAARGEITARWRVRSSSPIQGMCRAGDNAFIASTLDAGNAFQFIDSLGILRHAKALPWKEYEQAHMLHRQLALASNAAQRSCIAALLVGPGIAIVRADGTTQSADYVEPFNSPAVHVRISYTDASNRVVESRLDHRVAASDLAVIDGYVYTAFVGASATAGRILDVYDAKNLKYVESWSSKEPLRRIAAAGSQLLVATYDEGIPIIRAYAGILPAR
jgi:hypothetical protein